MGEAFDILHSQGGDTGQYSSYAFGSRPYTPAYTSNDLTLDAAGDGRHHELGAGGHVAVAYPGTTLAASGATGAVTWAVTSGSLATWAQSE